MTEHIPLRTNRLAIYAIASGNLPMIWSETLRAGCEFVAWDQQFHDPIELPGRRKPLVTLRDAAQYIIGLPKAERELPQWETAIEVLMLVGEHGGDPMLPHIAMMKALHRDRPRAASAPRRKAAKVYKVIR
jgi:hypothetical protein